MTKRMEYRLELTDDTATMYIEGSLTNEHVDTLIQACEGLGARSLRVDLHGLQSLSAEAIGAVRRLLHAWRERRNGEFKLSTSHMLATLYEVHDSRPVPAPAWSTPALVEPGNFSRR